MAYTATKTISETSQDWAALFGDRTDRTLTQRKTDGLSRLTNGFITGKPAEHLVHGLMLATAGAAITKNGPAAALGLGILGFLWIFGDSDN